MIVSSSSSSYTSTTEKSAKRGADMFVLDENRQQEGGSNGQGNALTGGDTAFSARLTAMFLIPERPEPETGQGALETGLGDDTYSIYEKEFMELADKTLAERIRDQYLKDRDLTEDNVNAMSAEARKAIENDIRNAILEAMGINEEQQTIAITINVPAATDIVAADAEDETTQL